ncbi:MAG: DUF305 domain-containing protein [Actinobacteria bacterium]|nr:DUF305 domain-containing protein [Actinomycetota bacterium]MCA1720027.1 DUF305 domain-containing protein [Actinomycetota bacterium]
MTFNIKHRTARRLVPAAVALAGLALVAGCGGSSSGAVGAAGGSSQSSSAAHNAADVTFATDMIPHHAQAVEMADMALAAAVDPEVKSLATAIKGAQDPEIKTMTGWLTDWKAPVPMTGMGHSMSGGGMGMMSADEMAALGKATGPAFDKLWVDMMTRHHTGAIEMAKTELSSGKYDDAKALAQQIVTSQTAEVAKMAAIAKRLA